ncbi:hypothetical protein LR69_00385 [Geobacillus sp. BCO2]|nr:hypothetical protein LR69_00385 [Geobacillus sp. BCO2]
MGEEAGQGTGERGRIGKRSGTAAHACRKSEGERERCSSHPFRFLLYPSETSATNYIVHEQHVWKVVHELLISGAEAVAINGQRISHRSYIVCNGPVIEVDGTQHAAPFVISAIGNPNVLMSALELPGGIVDELAEDHIDVKVEKQGAIVLDPVFAPEP